MPPVLDAIQAPAGAFATVVQQSEMTSAFLPRGMHMRRSAACHRPARKQNAPRCPAFEAVANGFLAARFVEVGEDPEFQRRLLKAEDAELRSHSQTKPSEDDSLPPRPCSVILLLPGMAATSLMGRLALDAFGHFASGCGCIDPTPVASVMRCAALAGVDADLFLKKCGKDNSDDSCLAVRWLLNDALHTCFFSLQGSSQEDFLLSIQNALFVAFKQHCAPVHDLAFLKRTEDLKDFEYLQALVHEDFYRLQAVHLHHPEPHVKLTVPAEKFVRIIRRPQQIDDVNGLLLQPSAYHGLVLCSSAPGVAEEVDRLMSFGTSLPMPAGMEGLGIHIVSAEVESFPLRQCVTLFGASGSAGAPLNSPGTWIWRFVTRVVPYCPFGNDFLVQPCHESSLAPGEEGLMRANLDFFQRAANVAECLLVGKPPPREPMLQRRSSSSELLRSKRRSLDANSEEDDEESMASDFLTAALCLGLPSRRMTLGDLGRQLSYCAELTDFFREATLRFGIETPLPAAFAKAADVLSREAERCEEESAEVDRWKRIANGALAVQSTGSEVASRWRTTQPALLQLLNFGEGRTFEATVQNVISEVNALVGAAEVSAPMTELAHTLATSAKTAGEAFLFVSAICFAEPVAVFVLDAKRMVSTAYIVGRGHRGSARLGDAIEAAQHAGRAFLMGTDHTIVECLPRKKRKKAKAAPAAAEVAPDNASDATVATVVAAPAATTADGDPGPSTAPLQTTKRKTIPIDMPRAPKINLKKWRHDRRLSQATRSQES